MVRHFLLQGQRLLPDIRGKDVFFQNCIACHGFESRMAKIKRDEDGWRSRVQYMRDAMGYFIAEPRRGFTDAKAEDVVYFLNQAFGEDSVLPRSPADLPGYQETVRKFSDEALKIVYVEYETPGPDRMPWSAHPGQGWQILGSLLRACQQDRAARSGDRQDGGISGAEHRHGGDPFRGAGARRLGLADRAGLRQARQMGSADQGDHRVPGRLGASTPSRSRPTAWCGRPAG